MSAPKYIHYDVGNFLHRLYARAFKIEKDPFKTFEEEILYLLKSFKDTTPTFSFDCEGGNYFRKDLYTNYKAQRPLLPNEFLDYKEKVKTFLKNNYLTFEIPKMEADDVMASLANKYFPCYVCTSDLDLCAVIDSDRYINILRPTKGGEYTIVNEDKFKGEFQIEINQLFDYKGLVGDNSDNYKGCPGIGPKTTIKLLTKYQHIDGIYAAIKANKIDLSKPLINKLIHNKEYVYLCKKLATIITDLQIMLPEIGTVIS